MPDASSSDGGPMSCNRQLASADRVRRVVVSHPFASNQNDWEVLALSAGGTLATSGTHFQMGRATEGEIVLTPDGEIGAAAQSDGSVGVFQLDADGTPHVISASLSGSFYAVRLVMDPSGDFIWVLDTQWRNNGGGIYRVRIGCDGMPSDEGPWAASKLPAGPTITSSAASFGDDQAIVASMTQSSDGQFVLIGDNSEFSGIPNRVAVLAISGSAVEHKQVLSPVNDPVALVPSPFDNTVLATSGYGNALYVLETQASATEPYRIRGELTYQGARPQLPGATVAITRGMLRGRVLVAEVGGVRQVQFAAGAVVTVRGLTLLGSGSEATVGALGVQP